MSNRGRRRTHLTPKPKVIRNQEASSNDEESVQRVRALQAEVDQLRKRLTEEEVIFLLPMVEEALNAFAQKRFKKELGDAKSDHESQIPLIQEGVKAEIRKEMQAQLEDEMRVHLKKAQEKYEADLHAHKTRADANFSRKGAELEEQLARTLEQARLDAVNQANAEAAQRCELRLGEEIARLREQFLEEYGAELERRLAEQQKKMSSEYEERIRTAKAQALQDLTAQYEQVVNEYQERIRGAEIYASHLVERCGKISSDYEARLRAVETHALGHAYLAACGQELFQPSIKCSWSKKTYDAVWAALRTMGSRGLPIAFDAIPWPSLEPVRSAGDISAERVRAFFNRMYQDHRGITRRDVYAELLRWHPDKLVELGELADGDKEIIQNAVNQITVVLNDLLKEASAGRS